jgi:Cu+-exporting ATPase
VVEISTLNGFSESELLRLAAAVEQASEHPLADAIVAAARERKIVYPPVADFDSPAGKGAQGIVEGLQIRLGNEQFLEAMELSGLAGQAEKLRQSGASVIYCAVDGRLAGLFAIADRVKATTPAALKDLKGDGVRIVMLTGDNRTTALAVAGRLGISDVEAEVLPGHKSDVVGRLRAQGHVVAMAGDGVNDAPALAAADIGIAMGPGTDVAMESAGVTLLSGDLSGIMRARILSAATMRNIRQNLFFAFVYNAVGIPVAAGMLYPVFGILLSPVFAAAAMALSSVSVIANALRLQLVRLD